MRSRVRWLPAARLLYRDTVDDGQFAPQQVHGEDVVPIESLGSLPELFTPPLRIELRIDDE